MHSITQLTGLQEADPFGRLGVIVGWNGQVEKLSVKLAAVFPKGAYPGAAAEEIDDEPRLGLCVRVLKPVKISRSASEYSVNTASSLGRRERLQGKGHVVRRMFADIEANAYVLVDGDDTYDAAAAPARLRLLADETLDMVTGARAGEEEAAFRRGHRPGNQVLTGPCHSGRAEIAAPGG